MVDGQSCGDECKKLKGSGDKLRDAFVKLRDLEKKEKELMGAYMGSLQQVRVAAESERARIAEVFVCFAHPPISPICRTPFFPYLTFYSSFLRPPRSSRADAPPSPSKRPRSPPRSSRRGSSSLARRHHP